MSRLSNLIIWIIKIIIAVVCSIMILSAFTLVYWNSGVHILNPSGSTDYKWESERYKSNMIKANSKLYFEL